METVEGAIYSYATDSVGQEEIPGNKGFKDSVFDAWIRLHTSFANGHAWCVYFCWACWRQSYLDFGHDVELLDEEFSGGAVRTFRHFKKLGWTSEIPRKGSIAIWQKYKNGSATQQGHAAIVEDWDNSYIYTIDGNTNDKGGREGYIVADGKRRAYNFRTKKGLVLLGFIHPKY